MQEDFSSAGVQVGGESPEIPPQPSPETSPPAPQSTYQELSGQESSFSSGGITPDNARDQLEKLAGRQEFSQLVSAAFLESLRIFLPQQALSRLQENFQRLVSEERMNPEQAREIFKEILKSSSTFSQRMEELLTSGADEASLKELIDKFKESQDPLIKALGYDLDLAILERRISRLDSQQSQEEKSELEGQKKSLEEERNKLRIKNQDGTESEIPNQLETVRQLAENVALALKETLGQPASLTAEEKRRINDDPVSFLVSNFGQIFDKVISMDEEGNLQINSGKLENFLSRLQERKIISPEQKNQLIKSSEEAKGLIQSFIKEGKDKFKKREMLKRARNASLGFLFILFILMYNAYKGETGGRGGHF